MSTYVISDLHGQYNIFKKLLDILSFGENDYMYVLGDAIDRGKDGIKILQEIMDAPNMDLLIGNHEYMMLNSVATNGCQGLWGESQDIWIYNNGGDITFEQYCKLSDKERKALLTWLNTRKLTELKTINGMTFCLTHSFFNDDLIGKRYEECDPDDVWSVVWKSPYREGRTYIPISRYAEKDWTFIIGHVPVQKIAGTEEELKAHYDKNVIFIDGGCAYHMSGRISDDKHGIICLKLEDLTETIVAFAEK